MFLRILRPKKWKKVLMGTAAAAATSIAVICFVVRLAPAITSHGEFTAMTAAGFILPGGAAKALSEKFREDAEHQTPSPDSANSALVGSSNSSLVSSSPSSPAPSQTESALTSSKAASSSSKVWKGKAIPIREVQLSNAGTTYKNIVVRNSNKNHGIDIPAVLAQQPDVKIKKDGTPQVLIYHTHTTESFMEEDSSTYYSDMPTRSQDNSKNVVAVGNEIAKRLEAAGIGVIHDTTCHDYPAYNGSYDRSAQTIAKNLEKYPSIQVTLDIHRDALGGDKERLKPTATVNGKKAAQVMILSGCDDDGTLGFPDWEYNLRLAMRLQQACSNYGGSFIRPLNFIARKYNEHMTHGSLLVEFGTEVNTLEEVKYSGQLFGDALVEVLNGLT